MLDSNITQSNAAKCPKCGTYSVRRAHRRGLYERIISLANFYPYDCVQCPDDVRFYYRKK